MAFALSTAAGAVLVQTSQTHATTYVNLKIHVFKINIFCRLNHIRNHRMYKAYLDHESTPDNLLHTTMHSPSMAIQYKERDASRY